MGKKAILATGCFDKRIKVVSFKTLKPLISLNFHQGIINQVILEAASQEG